MITVGGEAFSTETISRVGIRDFAVTVQAAVFDNVVENLAGGGGDSGETTPTNTSYLYLDNMWIVPADHFLHAEFETQIGGATNADKRAELYTAENGSIYGLIVHRNDTDVLGNPHPTARQVYETIDIIDGESWGMPSAEHSKMVFVADSTGSTLGLAAEGTLEIQVVNRTAGL